MAIGMSASWIPQRSVACSACEHPNEYIFIIFSHTCQSSSLVFRFFPIPMSSCRTFFVLSNNSTFYASPLCLAFSSTHAKAHIILAHRDLLNRVATTSSALNAFHLPYPNCVSSEWIEKARLLNISWVVSLVQWPGIHHWQPSEKSFSTAAEILRRKSRHSRKA